MFASVLPGLASSSKYAQGAPAKTQSYAPQPSGRFSVHIFKNPAFFQQAPQPPKFDQGYRPPAPPDPQQSQNWYSNGQQRYDDPSKRFVAPPEAPKPTRVLSNSSATNTAYDQQRPRTSTSYAIYPNAANGTYIYEQSIGSKSDIYSSSEYDSMSATTFSPAMSTDSTLTLKSEGPEVDDRASRSSAPSLQNSFSGQPMSRTSSTNYPVHENLRSSPEDPRFRAGATATQGRTTTPVRLPSQAADATRSAAAYAPPTNTFAVPQYAESAITESEVDDMERLAKFNAELNAAASASYYSSGSDTSTERDPRGGTSSMQTFLPSDRQVFPGAYLQDSPEEVYPQPNPFYPAGVPTAQGVYFPTAATSGSTGDSRLSQPPQLQPIPSRRLSAESEQFIPAFGQQEWERASDSSIPQRSRVLSQSYAPPSLDSGNTNTSSSDRRPLPMPPPPSGIARQRSIHQEQRQPRVDGGNTRLSPDPRDPRSAPDPTSRTSPPHDRSTQTTSYFPTMDPSSSMRGANNYPPAPNTHERVGVDIRRDTRTPAHAQSSTEQRPSYRRQDSFVGTAPTAIPERPSSFYAADTRQATTGILSTSPTSYYPSQAESNSRPPAMSQSYPPPSHQSSASFAQTAPPSDPRQRRNSLRSSGQSPRSEIPPQVAAARREAMVYERQEAPILAQPVISAQAPLSRNSSPPQLERSTSRSRVSFPEPQPRISPPEAQRRNSDGDRPSTHIPIVPPGTSANLAGIGRTNLSNQHPPEPQRRYSDGDQTIPSRPTSSSGRNSAPLTRNVRWNDNLICPSPIFASQRRKGWFNRRGDQLWTNGGSYKPAAPGEEYPADLDEYPEYGHGWMNEEGVRIDMGHRLFPKAPLRSALKQVKP
ncbi:hypothetical protein BDQ12DRAFT_77161 [Crucibulum laeve]|uniref:Uncharacterized protein n=1 Tax=Crucibulum laeve TaxID=68775 RepID=A0A5C3M3G9_9AGAR|nr:hypothetical protein BDQ12DRAFT_77161 [Crucibulum laeve]